MKLNRTSRPHSKSLVCLSAALSFFHLPDPSLSLRFRVFICQTHPLSLRFRFCFFGLIQFHFNVSQTCVQLGSISSSLERRRTKQSLDPSRNKSFPIHTLSKLTMSSASTNNITNRDGGAEVTDDERITAEGNRLLKSLLERLEPSQRMVVVLILLFSKISAKWRLNALPI